MQERYSQLRVAIAEKSGPYTSASSGFSWRWWRHARELVKARELEVVEARQLEVVEARELGEGTRAGGGRRELVLVGVEGLEGALQHWGHHHKMAAKVPSILQCPVRSITSCYRSLLPLQSGLFLYPGIPAF